jgi:acyl-coenzyme A synthetase/AMP-(fatty) acid ligase
VGCEQTESSTHLRVTYLYAVVVTDARTRALWDLVGVGGPVEREGLALVDGDRSVCHAELVDVVRARLDELALPARSLVVLAGSNRMDTVLTYLALHLGGHVPILTRDHADGLAAAWPATAVVHTHPGGWDLERTGRAPVVLHPDLALLMSTSGSTGSPKLVRLSQRNLTANAVAIAEYLRLGPHDRGVTSLPLHYCYGLSVLHAHLAVGAGVVLTDASVVDPCFRRAMQRHGVTNLAGVPHTFDLLEAAGFDWADHPTLRFVTAAGGRLAPERVLAWGARARAAGGELFVMYGQTEATARIAYLPPDRVRACPTAIGVPIPGVTLSLRPHPAVDDPEVGELVVRGPNVMLGYAEEPADLALGRAVEELATGDLARFRPDVGVYEVVGRAARFIKPFGLRIDLDRVEDVLAARWPGIAVTGDDRRLVAAAPGASMPELVAATIQVTGLPAACVAVVAVDAVPRTAAGKPDYAALRAHADHVGVDAAGPDETHESVAALYRHVLGVADLGPDDSFGTAGGDSLSYIECAVALEAILHEVPDDWHVRPVTELDGLARRTVATGAARRLALRPMDTTVVLRAVAIGAVVATHMRLFRGPGGAHLLLGVAGYNLSRFHLPLASARARVASASRSLARIAIPTSMWIGVNMFVAGGYSVGSLLLVNTYTGSPWRRDGRWQYWFVEAFVMITVAAVAVLAIPPVHRWAQRAPFGFALGLLVPGLAVRYRWIEFGDDYNYLFRAHSVAWFFVLGWLVHAATRHWQRLVTSALVLTTVPDFFGDAPRERFIMAGFLLLIWLPRLPVPAALHRPVALVAESSLAIYLLHWQVWPPLDRALPRDLAWTLTLALGVVAGVAVRRLPRLARATRAQSQAMPHRASAHAIAAAP